MLYCFVRFLVIVATTWLGAYIVRHAGGDLVMYAGLFVYGLGCAMIERVYGEYCCDCDCDDDYDDGEEV